MGEANSGPGKFYELSAATQWLDRWAKSLPPGDNAAAGSFFSLLQNNVLDRRSWATRDELRIAIITWIERTYHHRRQTHLDRLTPTEYETIMTPTVAQAA